MVPDTRAHPIAVRPSYLAFGTPRALAGAVHALVSQRGWFRLAEDLPVLVHPRCRLRLVAYPHAAAVHQPVLDIACYTRSGAVTWSARLCVGVPDEFLTAFVDSVSCLADSASASQGGDLPAGAVLADAGWTPYLDTMDPADHTRGLGSPDGMADFSRSISPSHDHSPYFWRFSAGVPGQMWSAALSRDAPPPVITALVAAMADPAPAIRDRTDVPVPLPHLAPYLHLTDLPDNARAAAAGRTLARHGLADPASGDLPGATQPRLPPGRTR